MMMKAMTRNSHNIKDNEENSDKNDKEKYNNKTGNHNRLIKILTMLTINIDIDVIEDTNVNDNSNEYNSNKK